MSKLWVIIKREVRISVWTRSFLIGVFTLPILLIGMMFLPRIIKSSSETEVSHIAIAEVNDDRLRSIDNLLSSDTTSTVTARWDVEYRSVARPSLDSVIVQWSESALAGDLDAFIIVDTTMWTANEVTFYAENITRPRFFRALKSEFTAAVVAVRLAGYGVLADSAQQLLADIEMTPQRIGDEGTEATDFVSDFLATIAFVVLLLMTVLAFGFQVMRNVIEEKSSRIVEVLLSSVSPFQLMMGKVVGQGIAAIIQLVAWIVVGGLFMGVGVISATAGSLTGILRSDFVLWFGVFFVLGYFFFSAWLSWVGAVVTSEQEAQPFMTPAIMLMSASFLVSVISLENPDSVWAQVLSFIPPMSPALMIMRLSFSSVPAWQPLLSAIILGLAGVGMTWVSARIFRVGILLMGKRLTVPEIYRWLRHG
ncbi:MAG: ABC transporter permease subunit [candidate division Zixibacteria bacterium]|nr:ABC transporter permease subunit [candidate division Zixibacteria bacterium]